MYRILTFLMSGLVGFLLVGTVMAQQLAAGSLEVKPGIATRPQAAAVHQMTGTVKSIDLVDQILSVKNKRGEQNFSITPETRVKKGRVHLKLAELKPGSEVTVKYWLHDGKKQAGSVKLK